MKSTEYISQFMDSVHTGVVIDTSDGCGILVLHWLFSPVGILICMVKNLIYFIF